MTWSKEEVKEMDLCSQHGVIPFLFVQTQPLDHPVQNLHLGRLVHKSFLLCLVLDGCDWVTSIGPGFLHQQPLCGVLFNILTSLVGVTMNWMGLQRVDEISQAVPALGSNWGMWPLHCNLLA